MIYLDNAATTLYKPRAVEQAVRRAMYGAAGYARGGYARQPIRAGELVYACREQGSGAVRRGRAGASQFHAERHACAEYCDKCAP